HVAVLAPRERVRARDGTAEPIEDRPAREIREFADGPQAEQSQLLMHLHIDGEHVERQWRQERAAIIDRAHLARWGSLRHDASDDPTVRSNRRSHATRSKKNVGIATRRPGSPATTRSAAGDPRTAESAGAMSSTFIPPNRGSPTSTTTRRNPSLRRAAAVASA